LGFVPVRPPPAIGDAVKDSSKKSIDAATKGIDATGQYTGRQLADTSSLVSFSLSVVVMDILYRQF
jgi:hypothetical protein